MKLTFKERMVVKFNRTIGLQCRLIFWGTLVWLFNKTDRK